MQKVKRFQESELNMLLRALGVGACVEKTGEAHRTISTPQLTTGISGLQSQAADSGSNLNGLGTGFISRASGKKNSPDNIIILP